MTHQLSERAIVLNTTPVKESDLIVTLFCERSGKLSAYARGAKRSKVRFQGGVDLFDLAVADLRHSKGGLWEFVSFGMKQRFPGIRGNLKKFTATSLAAEVISHFAQEGDPHASILFKPFTALQQTIEQSTTDYDTITALVLFLTTTLEVSGFGEHSHLDGIGPIIAEIEGITGTQLLSKRALLT